MNTNILIIVTTILGTFLLISCILVLCFYYRWKKAKRQRKPDEHSSSLSVPSFFFQPETPVFLIGAENSTSLPQDIVGGGGKKNNKKLFKSKDKKKSLHQLRQGGDNGPPHVTSSEPNLYAEHGPPGGVGRVGGREPSRKVGSIRQLYASIGKKLYL